MSFTCHALRIIMLRAFCQSCLITLRLSSETPEQLIPAQVRRLVYTIQPTEVTKDITAEITNAMPNPLNLTISPPISDPISKAIRHTALLFRDLTPSPHK